MNAPAVSVLIVSYNVKQYLLHAVDTVKQNTYPGTIEIIVVDNNSYDDTVAALAQSHPDIRIIRNEANLGFGKAVNQAAGIAAGDFFLILNPDTIIQENTIAVLVEYLQTHPGVGLIGPKILNADGSLQPACKRSFPTIAVAFPKLLGLDRLLPHSRWAGRYNLSYLDPDQIHAVDAVSGSCLFLSADLFRKLHGFDERFFMFGEDLDLCYRIKTSGYEVHYVPTTRIVHYQGESVKSAPFDSLKAFYNAMTLFSGKHFSRSQGLFVRLGISLGIRIRQLFSLVYEWRSQLLSLVLDSLVITLAFLLAIPIRFDYYEPIFLSKGLVPVIYILFWILIGAIFQLYTRYILSYARAVLASVSGFFVAVAFTYFFKQYAFSRMVIIVAFALITVMIPGWRMLIHYLISRGVIRPVTKRHNLLFTRKALIVGVDAEGIRVAKNLLKRFDTGLDILGFCDYRVSQAGKLPLPFLGSLADLRDIVKTHAIRELIFASGKFTNREILRLMDLTKDQRLTYRVVPRKQDVILGKTLVEELGDYSFVNIEYNLFRRLHSLSKRLFDLLAAGSLLVILAPLIGGMAALGKLRRETYWAPDGRKFSARRFVAGGKIPAGIPLLWPVFTGHMSIVGGPLIPADREDPRLLFKPGLTSLEKLRRVEYSPEDRKWLDHYYIQHQSFSLDLEIIMKTLFGN